MDFVTKCKVVVEEVVLQQDHCETVKCYGVLDSALMEKPYALSKAAPALSLTFTVLNKDLLGKFRPGQYFYVELTPAKTTII